ncbi:DUF3089 domain-containing protein [Brevundimonas sp. TWP2-3-2]|uniref:DUF3089 domain-containing protein n=1 Tax=unclassified Brevundimonas TaxID=2622653 RepID=UPI003CED3F65
MAAASSVTPFSPGPACSSDSCSTVFPSSWVLIGQSQGVAMITGLITQQIDGETAQEQIVSALILGAPIMVSPGRDVSRSRDRRPGRPEHPDHPSGSELGPSPHRRR